jgi:hypothetical protein
MRFDHEKSGLDIGHGLMLSLQADGQWQISGVNGTWLLQDERDFYRVVTLLEMSFMAAEEAVTRYAVGMPNATPFQFDAVVRVALQSQTEHWASRALEWIPHLPLEKREAMGTMLTTVVAAKWASQKLRQCAERELKRLFAM